MSEDSIRRGDAIVTGQRQVHACAHAISANRGDHWNGKPVDGEREGLTRAGELKGLRRAEPRDLLQVSPDGKEFFVARDDKSFQAATLGFASQLVYCVMQNHLASHAQLVGVSSG